MINTIQSRIEILARRTARLIPMLGKGNDSRVIPLIVACCNESVLLAARLKHDLLIKSLQPGGVHVGGYAAPPLL